MHRDEASLPQVEHVARVGELVLVLDGDDLVALVAHVLAELEVGPERGVDVWMCGCVDVRMSGG